MVGGCGTVARVSHAPGPFPVMVSGYCPSSVFWIGDTFEKTPAVSRIGTSKQTQKDVHCPFTADTLGAGQTFINRALEK